MIWILTNCTRHKLNGKTGTNVKSRTLKKKGRPIKYFPSSPLSVSFDENQFAVKLPLTIGKKSTRVPDVIECKVIA